MVLEPIAIESFPLATALRPIAIATSSLAVAVLPIAILPCLLALAFCPIATVSPSLAFASLPIATQPMPIASASLPITIFVFVGAKLSTSSAITGAALAQVIIPVAISIANSFFVEQLLVPWLLAISETTT